MGLPQTNNRAEMTAVLRVLEHFANGGAESHRGVPAAGPLEILVLTDSTYVAKGINDWMEGWARRGWKKRDGTAVKNEDLWRQLRGAVVRLRTKSPRGRGARLSVNHVKGHSGNPGNEAADALAVHGAQRAISHRDWERAVGRAIRVPPGGAVALEKLRAMVPRPLSDAKDRDAKDRMTPEIIETYAEQATCAALDAEMCAAAAQKAAKEGKVELAQEHAQRAKELANQAQKAAAMAEKASLAHGNPPTKLQ